MYFRCGAGLHGHWQRDLFQGAKDGKQSARDCALDSVGHLPEIRTQINAAGNRYNPSKAVSRTRESVKFKYASFARTGPARSWLIVACLLLFAASMAAQAVHFHPGDTANDIKHCPTCQMAHSALQVAS